MIKNVGPRLRDSLHILSYFRIQIVLPSKSIRNEKILETLMVQANSGMYRVQDSYLEACQNVQKQASESVSLNRFYFSYARYNSHQGEGQHAYIV